MLKNENVFIAILGFFWGISIFPSAYHFQFINFIKSSRLNKYTMIFNNGNQITSNVENFLGTSCIVLSIVAVLLLIVLGIICKSISESDSM